MTYDPGLQPHDPAPPSPLADLAAPGQLDRIQRHFPGHRIWREVLPGRTRYVARRIQPGPGPHTVVTPDLAELLTALASTSQPPPLPRRTATDG